MILLIVTSLVVKIVLFRDRFQRLRELSLLSKYATVQILLETEIERNSVVQWVTLLFLHCGPELMNFFLIYLTNFFVLPRLRKVQNEKVKRACLSGS